MATLVLTAVGTVLGGPIGGAIGAIAGQAIDAEIFKPAGRQGPRLSDLRVQTSAYGTQMPRLFGRMRVAGTVIWATDLIERSETSGGGKGQPSVTRYNYEASFAVVLSSRPILRIERIWADGNLLRGAGGDFKTGVGAFRVHLGDPDQAPDPLIVADRGGASATASRGLAYAVFEGLQLADFGNRIPSLTFEVVADDEAVSTHAVADDVCGAVAVTRDGVGDEPTVLGYAASGERAGDALAPLLDSQGLLVRSDGLALALVDGVVGEAALLARAEDVRLSAARQIARREAVRDPDDAVPRRLSVRYYERDRDYQAGLQSVERQGAGRADVQIDMPAVLDASSAHATARRALRSRVAGRRSMTLSRGWAALALRPGDAVMPAPNGGRWRIEAVEWESMAVRLMMRALGGEGGAATSAGDAGHGVLQPDILTGPTHLALLETPQLGDEPVGAPQIFAAACGDDRAWRSATLLLRDPALDAYAPIGRVRRATVLGVAEEALAPAATALFDRASTLVVALHDSDAMLAPANDAALIDGANACLIGSELVQFGEVSQIAPRRFRLSRLLRGRRGTEAETGGHAVGEPFVLLQADSLFAVDGVGVPGRLVELAAQGLGDSSPSVAALTVAGLAAMPIRPVHLRIAGDALAGVSISWIRRSRAGWRWRDGTDVPLGEETEAYRVEIWAGSARLRSVALPTPDWFYPAVDIASDRALAGGVPLAVHVRQVGTFGAGPALAAPVGV